MPDQYATKLAPRPLRVLYAEDMIELRDLMRIIMDGEGHVLDTCENGQLALDRLSANPMGYDLLITDHHMPIMNGLELVHQVRKMAFPGKILVFSSELSPAVKAAYVALRVDRVLPKPIWPAMLRELFDELFATSKVAGRA